MNRLSVPLSGALRAGQPTYAPSVRKALLVVGVSRSGTSVISRLLHSLGAAAPKTLMGAGHGNPMGHWEPQALVTLNDDILAGLGMRWSDPRPIPPAWFSSRPAYDALLRISRQIQIEYGDAALFVLKDPRLVRLLPLYLAALDILNIEPLMVLPARPPAEAIASLVNRDGMSAELAEVLWLRGIVEAEFGSRDCLRGWLTFDSLLTDWEAVVAKLGRDLRLIWPNPPEQIGDEVNAFLKPRFRHRPAPEDRCVITTVAAQAWNAAEQAIEGQETSARCKFDAVRMILRDFDRFGAVLGSVASEDLRLTLQKSRCWRLIQPFYAMERLARRGRA